MTRTLRAAAAALAILAIAPPAAAHFQLVYTPEANVDRPGHLPLRLVFAHPASNGHVMDMAVPLAFYSLFRGVKTDLAPQLSPIAWTGGVNAGAGFAGVLPVRRSGDYIMVLEPVPYLETAEDVYIQQITKSFVNKGGLPTDWHEPVGLKAEIVPLAKPYALYAGGSFSGIVLSDGAPVPGAEIEVEYLNHAPDLATNAFEAEAAVTPPSDAFVTQTIFADQSGTFTYGLPRAGVWGFCALGVGPDTSYAGKELSQDAVIWVQAYDMK